MVEIVDQLPTREQTQPRKYSRRAAIAKGRELTVKGAIGVTGAVVLGSALRLRDQILGTKENKEDAQPILPHNVAPAQKSEALQPDAPFEKKEAQPKTQPGLVINSDFSLFRSEYVDGKPLPIPNGWTAYPNNQWAEFFPSADPKDPNTMSVKRGISDVPAWISDPFTVNPNSEHKLRFSTMVHNFRKDASEIEPLIIIQALDSKNEPINGFAVDCGDIESNAMRTLNVEIPHQQWPEGTQKARIKLTYREIKGAGKTNSSQKVFYYQVNLTPKVSA